MAGKTSCTCTVRAKIKRIYNFFVIIIFLITFIGYNTSNDDTYI